jgi:hypothetical protein
LPARDDSANKLAPSGDGCWAEIPPAKKPLTNGSDYLAQTRMKT